MNKIGIGVIGCGTVGSGLIRNLPKANALIGERLGVQLEIKSIAVRNSAKNRDPLPITPLEDWKKVISDPAVQIVVELVGGTQDAFLIAEATLKAKKPLVTANKALLAERGQELFPLAQKSATPIYFEASVAGGIPVLKGLREGLVANQLLGLHGIINGTSNYILSRMAPPHSNKLRIWDMPKPMTNSMSTESMQPIKPPSSASSPTDSCLSFLRSRSRGSERSNPKTSALPAN